MIFTSLGLLVVAAGFLIAGITKSSVALLTMSLVITVAAGVVLVMVSAASKRMFDSGAIAGPGPAPVMAGGPATMPAQPVMMYVPMQAAPMQAPMQAPVQTAPMPPTTTMPTVDGNGATPPVVGYDSMTAVQVTRLIDSGALTDEQLASLRRYEETHAARKTVLDRLDTT